jgi:hypothetical protein
MENQTPPEEREVLNQFISELLKGVDQAGSFVSEQAPLVIKEYLMWAVLGNLMTAAAMFTVCWGMYKGFRWYFRKELHLDKGYGKSASLDPSSMVLIFPGVAFAIAAFVGFGALMHAAQSIIAPRVYLIEQLSGLLK